MDYIDSNLFKFVKKFVQLKSGNRVKVVWYLEHFKFTEDQIRELAPFFNIEEWKKVSGFQYEQISEEFIREWNDKLNWMLLSFHYTFSYEFLREFKDKLDWRPICSHYKINNDFLREFFNYINWHFVARFQEFDFDFVKKWETELRPHIYAVIENESLTYNKKYVSYLTERV